MPESCLTTRAERAAFTERVQAFMEQRLPNAPLDQLRAIETAMFRYPPMGYQNLCARGGGAVGVAGLEGHAR